MSYSFLVVDDSSVVRKVVRRAVAMAGFDVEAVHESANGADALRVLGEKKVDVLLTDLNMPGMDGVELIRRMAEAGKLAKTCVVIVSSERGTQRIETLKRMGVRGYISKPFRPEQLGAIVRAALEGGAHAG